MNRVRRRRPGGCGGAEEGGVPGDYWLFMGNAPFFCARGVRGGGEGEAWPRADGGILFFPGSVPFFSVLILEEGAGSPAGVEIPLAPGEGRP